MAHARTHACSLTNERPLTLPKHCKYTRTHDTGRVCFGQDLEGAIGRHHANTFRRPLQGHCCCGSSACASLDAPTAGLSWLRSLRTEREKSELRFQAGNRAVRERDKRREARIIACSCTGSVLTTKLRREAPSLRTKLFFCEPSSWVPAGRPGLADPTRFPCLLSRTLSTG